MDGSSTQWNLSMVVFEGDVANEVDSMIDYAAAIPADFSESVDFAVQRQRVRHYCWCFRPVRAN